MAVDLQTSLDAPTSSTQTTGLTRRVRSRSLLDSVVGRTFNRTKLFQEGWGDEGVIETLIHRMQNPGPPPEIHVKWTTLPERLPGMSRMRGFFESPVQDLPIPPESRAAYFELLLPQGASPRIKPPICLMLASAREQGFARRRRFAQNLIERGMGVLILENPYQGARRPHHRNGAVDTVADQLIMHWMTIQESRALLQWLRNDRFMHVGVTGVGLGGFMAAYVGAMTPFEIAVVPCASGVRPSAMLNESVMARLPDWVRLQAQQTEGTARARMIDLLDRCALDTMPAPVDSDLVILVGARRDAVVPATQVDALANYWNVPIYWTSGGHFSAAAYRRHRYQDAILDAFGTLLAKYSH